MIHSDHPYREPPEEWDPARRFRGRLAAPVTIVTSGGERGAAGLTVSSLFVVEGAPAAVHLVVGPTTDLWEVAGTTGRLVIHVAPAGHEQVADVFAGLRPSPGGVFAGRSVTPSAWGPLLDEIEDRAFCTVVARRELGYTGVVEAQVDEAHVTELNDPLLHFRSRYRRLG